MAREKVKGFDSNEFIESVRESAVPTYHTAADNKDKQEAKSSDETSHPSRLCTCHLTMNCRPSIPS